MSRNTTATETQYFETAQAAAYFNLDEETLMAYVHQLSLTPRLDEQTGHLMLSGRDIELLKRAVLMPSQQRQAPQPSPRPAARDAQLSPSGGIRRFGSAPASPRREAVVPRPTPQSPASQALRQAEAAPKYEQPQLDPQPQFEPQSQYETRFEPTQASSPYYAEEPTPQTAPASDADFVRYAEPTEMPAYPDFESEIPQPQQLAPNPAPLNRPQPRPASSAVARPGGGVAQANNTALGGSLDKKDNLAVIVEAVSHAKEGILKDLARLLDDKLAGLDEVVVELIRCKSENDTLKDKLKAALDEKESMRYELSKFKPVQFGFYRKSN